MELAPRKPSDDNAAVDPMEAFSAVSLAHRLAENCSAYYYDKPARDFHLGLARENVEKLGNILGYTFTLAKQGSAERAIQRASIATRDRTTTFYRNQAARAADADHLKRENKRLRERLAQEEERALEIEKAHQALVAESNELRRRLEARVPA